MHGYYMRFVSKAISNINEQMMSGRIDTRFGSKPVTMNY